MLLIRIGAANGGRELGVVEPGPFPVAEVVVGVLDGVRVRRRVPESILARPKQGFAAPIGQWLAGPLQRMGQDLLFDGRLARRGIVRDSAVRELWDDHRSGRADHKHRLWAVVMLELWFRAFIDGAPNHTRENTEEVSSVAIA